MNNISLIGRILYALPFGVMGLNHFLMKDVFTGMLTSFIPGSSYTVLLTGVLLILACLSIIFRIYIRTICFSLAGLLLLFILSIHIPGIINGKDAPIPFIMLLKDTSLMGGSLIIATLYPNKPK
jgi:uncharacterized membrane protein YphA (DoxX/SURF4 family)